MPVKWAPVGPGYGASMIRAVKLSRPVKLLSVASMS